MVESYTKIERELRAMGKQNSALAKSLSDRGDTEFEGAKEIKDLKEQTERLQLAKSLYLRAATVYRLCGQSADADQMLDRAKTISYPGRCVQEAQKLIAQTTDSLGIDRYVNTRLAVVLLEQAAVGYAELGLTQRQEEICRMLQELKHPQQNAQDEITTSPNL